MIFITNISLHNTDADITQYSGAGCGNSDSISHSIILCSLLEIFVHKPRGDH